MVVDIYEVIYIVINNGNRTEWSPIRSAIIGVINKIGRPRSGSPIFFLSDSLITLDKWLLLWLFWSFL